MRPFARAAALTLLAACAGAPAAPAPGPAPADLRTDPAARAGTLPNGLRYLVLANPEPRGRASLRLLVLAGSMQEADDQRGVAHFVERLAYDGSARYSAGSLADRLRRLGMVPGADANSAASFDRTVYRLELGDAGAASVGEGLRILADFGGSLRLDPDMVEKERAVILGEIRNRDSAGYRTMVARLELVAAGTRAAERLPIGEEAVVAKCGRATLLDFYRTWYRPDRMAVVAVGDFDAAAVERQVAAEFSGLAPRPGAAPAVDLGRVADLKGVRTLYHPEPDATDTRVVIACASPARAEPDTPAARTAELARRLVVDIVSRRLAAIAKGPAAAITAGRAEVRDAFGLYREASVEVSCRSDKWTAGLETADRELRRALAFGFRPEELAEAVADARAELERAAGPRASADIAAQVVENLVAGRVTTSPADDLALLGPALARATVRECAVALQGAWAPPGRFVLVAGNARIGADGNAAVAFAYSKALATTVTPPGMDVGYVWAYGDFGPPGAVAERKHVDDLDLTLVTFANGVRLNVKKTDFEEDLVRVAARLGTGQLTEPAATEPGLSVFTNLTFAVGGLGKHGADEVRRILAGHRVQLDFASTMDAFLFTGRTNREDLIRELQLLAASISDPGFRPESLRVAHNRIETEYAGLEQSDRGPLAFQVPRLLFGGDPRFGLPAKPLLLSRTLGEVRAWLGPQLAHGPLEVSLVGDLDVDAAVEAAAATVGALPRRDPRPDLEAERRAAFPAQPFVRDFAVETGIQRSLFAVYWPTADSLDPRRAKRLVILAGMVAARARAKFHDQMGETLKSFQVASAASDVFPGYGYMVAIGETEPAKAKRLQDLAVVAAEELHSGAATAADLDQVKNPLLTSELETERRNDYWMSVLARAQERPASLDWARHRHADVESVSLSDVDELAKAYLGADRASRVIVHPAPSLRPPSVAVPPPDGL